MAVLALAAGGAFIGGSVAGAIGAQVGWLIGSFLGQALFAPSQKVEGPRLRDLQVQSATDGAPMPLAYGTVRVAGNMIWSTPIKEKKTKKKVKSGKGGPKTTQTTYTYSMSMAVGLHNGQITGIRRIWADSKLLYSVADGASPATFNANTARGTIRIYLGTATQTADPLIASAVGAANTPGFRDTAYLLLQNLQLADFANHAPNIEAEIVVNGAPARPTFAQTVPPGTANSAFEMLVDPLRSSVYYCLAQVTAGGAIYGWDCTANAPVKFATVTTAFNAGVGLMGTGEHHEIWIFGTDGTGTQFETFDASTGVTLQKGPLNCLNPVTGAVATLGMPLHYDPILDGFWGTTLLFANSQLHLFFVGRESGLRIPYFIEIGALGSTGGEINQQTMIDADGAVWITHSTARLIECKSPPSVHSCPDADGFDSIAPFLWSARGEIWIPRNTLHSTKGYYVFNLATRTFANSDAVLGTFARDYPKGVENAAGQAWFIRKNANDTDAQLRNSDGSLALQLSTIYTRAENFSGHIGFFPGVVIIGVFDQARCFYEYTLAQNGRALSSVVTDLCQRAGAGTPEVTSISADTVRGFVVARPMSARSALEPLSVAFSFDGVESDDLLKFVKRGGTPAVMLTADELGAHSGDSGSRPAPIESVRSQEEDLPATLIVNFFNQTTDYDFGSATARRLISDAKAVAGLDLPVVFTSDEANKVADRAMQQVWLEREKVKFALGPKHQRLEPTDVVTLPDARRVRLIRTTERPPGLIECEAVGDDQGAIISFAVGNTGETPGEINLSIGALSVGLVLDIPLLRDSDPDEGLYLAACGETSTWPGATFFESPDGGVSWSGLTVSDAPARIGLVVSGSMDEYATAGVWDHSSEIVVKLAHPGLSLAAPASLEAFYLGENAIALGNEDHWEIVQFFRVTANGDGTFTLRDFLRGRKGTEWAIKDQGSGSRFVVLEDPEVQSQAFSLGRIGVSTLIKAVTFNGSLNLEAADEEIFDAVACKPYAPVQVVGTKHASGDFTISWVRRARKNAGWLNSIDVPLDEPFESYEVEILDDAFSSVKRTIVDFGSPLTYTNAQATADFGSNPATIGLRIYQISSRVGRGYVGEGYGGVQLPPMSFSPSLTSGGMVLSGHDFTISRTSSNYEHAPTPRTRSAGKFYWEIKLDTISSSASNFFAGITDRSAWASGNAPNNTNEKGLWNSGVVYGGSTGFTYTTGDTVMLAWDATNGLLYFGKNGTWQNSADPEAGTGAQVTHTPGAFRPVIASWVEVQTFTASARFKAFHVYSIPGGFVPMN